MRYLTTLFCGKIIRRRRQRKGRMWSVAGLMLTAARWVTQRHFLCYIFHMDGSGIEWGFPLNNTSLWRREAWNGQQRARQVVECCVDAVRVDADRVLLSWRFGSASDVPRRYRLASWNSWFHCLWSLPIPFLNYDVSHSNLGLADRLSWSNISFDLLRSSAPIAETPRLETGCDGFRPHTFTSIMLVILLHSSQNYRTSHTFCLCFVLLPTLLDVT
jgi:hypothetical protein